MPLKKGSSQKTVSANIRTLVEDYTKSGRIGTSKPANKKAAVKQAVAISLRQAGKPKPKKFQAGGLATMTPGYEESMYAGSVVGMTEKEKAEAAAKAKAQSGTPAEKKEEEEQTRARRRLPLPSQSGQVEDQFPKFKQTRMQMRFMPEQYDVAKGPPPPGQRTAMRRGGKVTLNKNSRRK